ncbi:MAG: tryptophanase [Oscillospiraceae bacterium]|nr:tryptophanase [Oscillospiraceae bacterium]MBR7055780.1 tryptophanase [Oscillospiraceae bacterium]
MPEIKFYKHEPIPMEMHKVKVVQQLHLLPARERLAKMRAAGFNTFQLHNADIFMDMLTDSGVNAMSDMQVAATMHADDAYAGSETFFVMRDKLEEIFGTPYCLPAHQGRACENILATRFVKPGNCVIMNYHFTTAKAHITRVGGHVEELVKDEGLVSKSDLPFKGNIDLQKLEACIQKETPENVAFLRLESGTNLIGGQPISYENMKAATELAKKYGILTVLDASLLQDNLYFIKIREPGMADKSVREITRMIADLFDLVYFSARKFGFARGGAIVMRDEALFHSMEDLIPMFEGFLTYGGMSVREMEAMTVGFDESMDMDVISQGPQFIQYAVNQLDAYGIPVITPGGGLGAHLDCLDFIPHVPQQEYAACALSCALYICGGIRGMERGTLSEERNADGSERLASMELLRLAFPRRVFTLSQTEYVIDRVKWLYDHRDLVGGLRFVHEPATLRFFTGILEPIGDWPEKLTEAYVAEFGEDQ